jgi:hypothetical protein
MIEAAVFLRDMEGRNQDSIRNLVTAFLGHLGKEALGVIDVLKLELRAAIESIEVAALWLPESDLEMKLALASRCGDGARHFAALGRRLEAAGQPLAAFDPRQGGYSKLFAFFRSLQTADERAGAGFVTFGTANLARFEALVGFCEANGDPESARLFREELAPGEASLVEAGRQLLLSAAASEESQARARRASYRTVELVGELNDPALMRKFLARSIRK